MIASGRQRVLDLLDDDSEGAPKRAALLTQLLVDAVTASLEQRNAGEGSSPLIDIAYPVASELVTDAVIVARAAIEYCAAHTGTAPDEIIRDLRGWFLDEMISEITPPPACSDW